jgi:hypothetical protein
MDPMDPKKIYNIMGNSKTITFFSTGLAKQPTAYIDLAQALYADIKTYTLVKAYRMGLAGQAGKKGLPFILPAGVFVGGRKIENFVKSSGLLYVDIDAKSQTKLGMDMVRRYLTTPGNCPWLMALQASCGGKGLSCFLKIPKIKSREAYRAYYKEVERMFLQVGIVADKSCVNINRIRFMSYDPDTYINYQAETLRLKIEKVRKPMREPIEVDDNLKQAILIAVKSIERDKQDITADYNTWLYMAGLLHKVFGENQGRQLFHRISRFYPGYDASEADQKYNYCREFKNASPNKFFRIVIPKLKIK